MMSLQSLVFAFEFLLKVFAVFKGFVDFNATIKSSEDAKKLKKENERAVLFEKKPVRFSVFIGGCAVFVLIVAFIMTQKDFIHNNLGGMKKIFSGTFTEEGLNSRRPAQLAPEAAPPSVGDNPIQTQTPCRFRPGSNTFHADSDACIDASGCDAAVRLCLGAAESLGRRAAPDLLCPSGLGEAVSLRERQALDVKLRQRRCYPESYAWLVGVKGAEADDTRAYWRTVVCSENPTVFDDRQFDPFRPLPFAGCRN